RTFSHTPLFFFLITRPPPRSTLFPYTTLFRSHQQTARQPDESGLRQIRVFAQRYGEPAQRHRGAEQHEHLGDLPEPAVIGAKRRDHHRGAYPGEPLTVERDEARDSHPCTAAASSRMSRSIAAMPPLPSASISALPTATPSADRAAAAACAGVPMPKPTTTGRRARGGAAARIRCTWASRS